MAECGVVPAASVVPVLPFGVCLTDGAPLYSASRIVPVSRYSSCAIAGYRRE